MDKHNDFESSEPEHDYWNHNKTMNNFGTLNPITPSTPKSLNPFTLNPKPLNPKPQTPKPLNPKPLNP